jgi:putative transposase
VTSAVAISGSELEEGLLAFAVGAGLKVLDVILEHEAEQLAGPRGIHDPHRRAVRHGTDDGLVALGGRQVSTRRPRLRSADRVAEVALPTYQACTSTGVLGRETLQRMMAKLSARRYGAGLEPVGTSVEAESRATSKSAVSRRFVAATETALAELMAADLSSLDLVAFIVDGVHFAGHCCVVALGIDIEGNKHPLALEEGDTENATLVKDLIVGLRERGLDVTRPILAVLDGSKALASAVTAVLRWCAAGMFEAKKQFRRVNGHLHLRSLRTALNQHVQETVTPFNYSPDKEVAA